jgi:hypothetical protein
MKTLADLIGTNRRSNAKDYSCLYLNKSFPPSEDCMFGNFRRRGRIKNSKVYDERIADNVIVRTKHLQLGKSFSNSSPSNDQRYKNKVIKTKQPCDKSQFRISSIL